MSSDIQLYDPRLYIDPLKVFFPTFFSHVMMQTTPDGKIEKVPSPDFHYEIIDTLKQQHGRTVIVAPRGASKSSLVTFMWVLYTAVYGLSRFTIIASDSNTKAVSFLMRLKREIEDNTFFREVFQITKDSPWSRDDIAFRVGWLGANHRVRIAARGAGQSLRGYTDDVRPQLFIGDDVETNENCSTEANRAKLRDWFWTAVIPSMDPQIGKVLMIGTIIHNDSLLARFMLNPPANWIIKKFSMIREDGTSLWPDRFPIETIQRIKDEYIRQGMLKRFHTEYLNDITGGDMRVLDNNKIRYYDPLTLGTTPLRHYMAVDFGASTTDKADYTCIMVCAVNNRGDIYVREYVRDRMIPSEVIDNIYSLYTKYNVLEIGIETNGQQKVYYYMLEEAGRNRGKYLKMRQLHHNLKKEQRILAVQPILDDGRLYLQPTMSDLIREMKEFPNGRFDDVIDTLSNVVIVLSETRATVPRHDYPDLELSTPNLFIP